MDREITAQFVREYLWLMGGIAIDDVEAERLVPYVRGTRQALAKLYGFDVQHIRPSGRFDPAFPYETAE